MELKKTKDELQYHKYLSEVSSLNIVKEFLAENKDKMSKVHKQKLITKIIEE